MTVLTAYGLTDTVSHATVSEVVLELADASKQIVSLNDQVFGSLGQSPGLLGELDKFTARIGEFTNKWLNLACQRGIEPIHKRQCALGGLLTVIVSRMVGPVSVLSVLTTRGVTVS